MGPAISHLRKALHDASPYETTLRLTLILLLLYSAQAPLVEAPLRVLAGAMLVLPSLLRSPHLWWLTVAVVVIGNGLHWFDIDNHQYLIIYWTIACALSLTLSLPDPATYLRTSARVFVGLVFLFATTWKLVAGEYLDGTFFHYSFLTDARLRYVTAAVGDLPVSATRASAQAAQFIMSSATTTDWQLPLPASSSLVLASLGLSWLTIAVEGTVALTHIGPPSALYAIRHAALWAFIALTYLFLPVMGFAFVLTILGFAQCSHDDSERRWAYLILFGIIHFTLVPWQQLLATYF